MPAKMPARSTRLSAKRKRIKSDAVDGATSTSGSRGKKVRTLTNLDSNVKSLQKYKYSAENDKNGIMRKESSEDDSSPVDENNEPLRLAPEDPRISDLVLALKEKRKTVRHIGTRPLSVYSGNIMHFAQNLQFGRRAPAKLRQSVSDTVAAQVSELQLFRTASPFERRSTAVEWHPTNPNLVLVGSKGGEIILWDFNTINNDILIPGTGPNGSIQALKFLPHDSSRIITASVNGTVSLHTLGKNQKEVFMDTLNSYDDWYCSVDVHKERNVAVVGDNHGNITIKSLKDGEKMFESRLHRNKVTHLEFSPREEWLFASASTDQTVQLWDIRMLEGRNSSLAVLKHNKPVNSACFSQTSGTRLLTTDQKSDIRVYTAPTYNLSLNLQHPHRQFQHLTPIKASWHPLTDLIVVGRYPDENFPGYSPGELRTIDMFSADTGKLTCQLHDSQAKGIISLNKFSPNGEYLASGMGVNILLWSMRHDLQDKHSSLMAAMKQTGLTPGASGQNRNRKPKLTKAKKEKEKTAQAKLKLKTKTVTKKR